MNKIDYNKMMKEEMSRCGNGRAALAAQLLRPVLDALSGNAQRRFQGQRALL